MPARSVSDMTRWREPRFRSRLGWALTIGLGVAAAAHILVARIIYTAMLLVVVISFVVWSIAWLIERVRHRRSD